MDRSKDVSLFLLRFLCLEGAKNHCGVALPNDNPTVRNLHVQLSGRFPERWSPEQDMYECVRIEGETNSEQCWSALKTIRDNLVHANKAHKPDLNPRLDFLLKWSSDFMDELLKTEHAIGSKAQEFARTLAININR